MQKAYVNAAVYTGQSPASWASVILESEGKISAVGDSASLAEEISEAYEVIDLGGRMVMPGIHDAHTHLVSGLNRWEVALPHGAGEAEILDALRSWNGPRPVDRQGNRWLIGGRYWPDSFGDKGPDRAFLDREFPDEPVVLHDRSAHNVLVNSCALRLAGIDDGTPDTENGEVIRDATGRLTGELYEQARWPVFRALGTHADSVMSQAIRYARDLNHRYGVTSVQDASSTEQLLRVMSQLDSADELQLHVAAHLVWREESFGMAGLDVLDHMIDHHEDFASNHVDTRFVKFWLDGSPIPPYWTQSCIHDDGTVDEENLLIPQDEMNAAMVRFDAAGLMVKVHCGGEGAIRRALDAVEHARSVNGPDGPRHELAHCCLVHKDDFERFAALRVGAEMSPAVWHLPEHGVSHLYEFDSVARAGAEMTFGTDWSIADSPNLFPALQGAIEHGEQSIDLARGLAAMTINGAHAVGRSEHRGTIEVGKAADFIVLDRNLFDIPTSSIGGTQVLRTVFGGRTVYDAEN
ncbi:amidohydrolase [Rhodococcus fascians]|uniref:amidohydrolase n=1 Tax=Rhodococcoides fascians TaxID=1828 RepID=UPI001213E912|nr:amidohydrolase [Rhodococcus fascians]MBY4429618.1 amidohydrolase [Rhodococcus fascians]NIL82822.1 N-substituted formamide deformylase [Rhodococcus fascians]RZL75520.1 MAG: amidohydrolase [Rhodococcus sp. (in: high G+C Gram-positive bacteria)]